MLKTIRDTPNFKIFRDLNQDLARNTKEYFAKIKTSFAFHSKTLKTKKIPVFFTEQLFEIFKKEMDEEQFKKFLERQLDI